MRTLSHSVSAKSPMFAIISDIHANLEALSATLKELERLGPERIICLGDLVGYGPDPEKCVDVVRTSCEITLCGNHDFALVHGSREFNENADRTVTYHRQRLMPLPDEGAKSRANRTRWDYLKSLPSRFGEDDRLYVHGAPRNPLVEYLKRSDVKMKLMKKLHENFALVEHLCFIGHTHRPGVITDEFEFIRPDELDGPWRAQPDRKAIINVGSVGQPRDGDPRACFVTVHGGKEIRFHRVEYDVQRTAGKIKADGVINPILAERLIRGQ